MKRRILCFGDSNTYGYDFETGRFDDETRWTRRLGAMLGDGYAVIEEGLNGRTFIHDDPTEGGHKNGMKYLPPCLMSHNPLDLVVIMLGTNDTKERFGMNACTIAQCAQQMVLLAKQYALGRDGKPSRVLLVSPILVAEDVEARMFGASFGPKAAGISKDFAREYHRVAMLTGSAFLDAAKVTAPWPQDGIHITREGQEVFARAMAEKIGSIFVEEG
jgi:lysophospholipase L1-like esterase